MSRILLISFVVVLFAIGGTQSANAIQSANQSAWAQDSLACADVGIDPGSTVFSQCVADLHHALWACRIWKKTDCGLASSPRHPQPFADAKVHPARIDVVVTTRLSSCIKAPLCAAHTPDQLPAPKGSAARLRRGPLGNRSGERKRVGPSWSSPQRRRRRR